MSRAERVGDGNFYCRCDTAGAEPNNLNQLEKFLDNTCEAFGEVDILVNTTGASVAAPDMLLAEAQWNQSLSLKNAFFCLRELTTQMMIPTPISAIGGRSISPLLL